jgi:hypothetical protein
MNIKCVKFFFLVYIHVGVVICKTNPLIIGNFLAKKCTDPLVIVNRSTKSSKNNKIIIGL